MRTQQIERWHSQPANRIPKTSLGSESLQYPSGSESFNIYFAVDVPFDLSPSTPISHDIDGRQANRSVASTEICGGATACMFYSLVAQVCCAVVSQQLPRTPRQPIPPSNHRHPPNRVVIQRPPTIFLSADYIILCEKRSLSTRLSSCQSFYDRRYHLERVRMLPIGTSS